MSDPLPAAKATPREWIGLAVIALPCAVYAMDLTVLNLALPAISAELSPSGAELLWMVDIYGFLVAGLLITMGNLGDRYGRRRLLMAGAAAFALASSVAAFSSSVEMLIAMRALLGVAGATLAPSTLALIRNMFHDPQERQFAIGAWIASYSVGAAIGPLVGGVLLQFFWWGSVFLVAVPVMLMVLLLGPTLLPEYRDPQAGRVDLPSVGLSLVAVLATIYGLKQIAEAGVSSAALGAAAAGLLLGVVFVRRQSRLAYPMLELALFRSARFSAAIAAYALSCLAMFGIYIFITQYLQLVLGLTPLAAGIATVPWALGFVAASLGAPRLARRVGSLALLVWSLAAASAGFCLLLLADGPFGLQMLVLATVVISLGLAPAFTIGNEMIITAAPAQRAGAASALSETAAEFSGALGIALLGSLGMLLYRSTLTAAMPAGVPPESATAALATLGAAVAAAQALPAATGEALLLAARAAFTDALQLAALFGAVVVACASLLAARILRGQAAGGEALLTESACRGE